MRLWRIGYWLAGLCALGEAAKGPVVKKTGFDTLPQRYTYFEDSSVILYHDGRHGRLLRSEDDGVNWKPVENVPDKFVTGILLHPFSDKVAFVMGPDKVHYKTTDRGASWKEFKTPLPQSQVQTPLAFNAKKHGHILFAGEECDGKGGFWGRHCYDTTYYTTDMFDSKPSKMREHTQNCIFARSTKVFKEGAKDAVLCVDEDADSKQKFPLNLRLMASHDWFKTETHISSDNGPIRGVIGLGAVQTFIVAATRSPGTDEMVLYVTDDGELWDVAQFPHDQDGLKEDAYTILESRPYGIQVDVQQSHSFGALFLSNSNGTYFTKSIDFTNRNDLGIVDFENVANVEGIVLTNIVSNHKEMSKSRSVNKKLQSRISFDDGRKWQPLKAPEDSKCKVSDEDCSLHLYSAAAPHNAGRIFSSTVPGILMGVGSVGEYLLPYDECDLFISEDAGATWRLTKKEAHKYEWGDQGSVLVAVFDEDATDKVFYSFNRGKDWDSIDLGIKVRARILTTTPDSTTEKFTLVASRGKGEEDENNAYVFSIDFTGMRSNKCKLDKTDDKESDFEKWYARYDPVGNPTCLMGHRQFFWRKKADRDCYVGEIYDDPAAYEEDCPCTDTDFECDYNFERKDGKCLPAKLSLIRPKDACKDGAKTFEGPSGYRLIPGNTCNREKGVTMDAPIERDCEGGDSPEGDAPEADGKIITKTTDFDGHVRQYYYLERSETSSGSDETIIMVLDSDHVYKSHDGGKVWEQILKDSSIVAVVPNRHFKDRVYFFTSGKGAFYSKDRAKTITPLEMPSPPNRHGKDILDFHAAKSTRMLFTGEMGCESKTEGECRPTSFYTEDGGESWDKLLDYTDDCRYIGSTKVQADSKLIYCSAWVPESDTDALQLFSSVDYFENTVTLFTSIVGFAVFEEFIVVAEIAEGKQLQMQSSIDGETFAVAQFPPKFSVDHQQAFTVLDSVTKAIFLHITTNAHKGQEWGSVLKSNSNGTYYVTSLDFVNRDSSGYVDFEKLQGLEGVAVVNTVANHADVLSKGVRKALRTQMTHNDGGVWNYLTPPKTDSEGKGFSCAGSLDKCSLNLHGYTERADVRDTYSSGSAVGMMLGVGSVGSEVSSYEESNTFISSDGGITWREVHKGPYQWEFGDQGSIVVVVKDGEPTDRVLYSTDDGASWQEHIFAGEKMLIHDISTVPSDTSRRFLLYAKPESSKDEMRTISLDFAGLTDRKCELDENDKSHTDFYLWTPSHPSNENKCLFGHVAEYHRKDPAKTCYVGSKIPALHKVLQNCTCSHYDFECDFNYQRASDGTCQLIPGLAPPDHAQICTQEGVVDWMEPTGYRKIPLTTCTGGQAVDEGTRHPCPGHEEEFRKSRKRLGGFWLFMLVALPFGLAGCVGYIVYQRMGYSQLGQIRLGDDALGAGPGRPSAADLLEYPIIAISAVVALLSAIPMMAKLTYGAVSRRFGRSSPFDSRGSFARSGYDPLAREDAGLLSDDDDL
ncbi:hypothetical protein BCR37DRAFT_379793 [Protomyces lactucae-debilis]|uniref:VPS10 domain-containing protein n=1 Tax=Protomyces lactucae-debilis TaxID=2754530 RepID=A0A1Y2FGE3_PROLT|nr:uncharacterized protein BCR37DRAFT_379793 [Protomyces lactucae-debilis]ORY81895.1 hypothetical protein BCR37DRAFT_379793 [Protomyces lactucae-debilis]